MDPQNAQPVATVPAQGRLIGPSAAFGAAWRLFKQNWKICSAIIIVPIVLIVVLALIAGATAIFSSGGSAVTIFVVLYIAAMIVYIAAYAAFIDAVHKRSADPAARVTLGGQFAVGFRVFFPFLLVLIIEVLVTWGSAVFLFIPAVVMIVYTLFYMMTCVVTGKRGLAALIESYAIVRGRWWPVFGRFLFLALACIGLGLVYAIIMAGVSYVLSFAVPYEIVTIIIAVIQIVFQIVLVSVAIIYMYEVYMSLQATRRTDASVSAFKGWLIFFLIIGILAAIAYFTLFASTFRSFNNFQVPTTAVPARY